MLTVLIPEGQSRAAETTFNPADEGTVNATGSIQFCVLAARDRHLKSGEMATLCDGMWWENIAFVLNWPLMQLSTLSFAASLWWKQLMSRKKNMTV